MEPWLKASSMELVEHLRAQHLQWIEVEFPQLGEQFAVACRLTGSSEIDLGPPAVSFTRLCHELAKHFSSEEDVLFPAAVAVELAIAQDQQIERPPFGSIRNPATMLERDHEQEFLLLAEMRASCKNYRLDEDAPEARRKLYGGLRELEQALCQHRKLEDEILFPRAVKLEANRRLYKPR